jgi:hypothetical protein
MRGSDSSGDRARAASYHHALRRGPPRVVLTPIVREVTAVFRYKERRAGFFRKTDIFFVIYYFTAANNK